MRTPHLPWSNRHFPRHPTHARQGQGRVAGALWASRASLLGGPLLRLPPTSFPAPSLWAPRKQRTLHNGVLCSRAHTLGGFPEVSTGSAQGQNPRPPMDGAELRRGCSPAHCKLLVGLPGLVPALLLPPSCRPQLCPRGSQARLPPVPAEIRTARPVGLGVPRRSGTLDSTLSLPRA